MKVYTVKVERATDEWQYSISPFIMTVDGRRLNRHMTKDEVLANMASYLERTD